MPSPPPYASHENSRSRDGAPRSRSRDGDSRSRSRDTAPRSCLEQSPSLETADDQEHHCFQFEQWLFDRLQSDHAALIQKSQNLMREQLELQRASLLADARWQGGLRVQAQTASIAPPAPIADSGCTYLQEDIIDSSFRQCEQLSMLAEHQEPIKKESASVTSPPEVNCERSTARINIVVASASGIMPNGTALNCLCMCNISGKSSFQTEERERSPNPEWQHERIISDLEMGDFLQFTVLGRQPEHHSQDILGTVTLAFKDFYPAGFDGSLLLSHHIPGFTPRLQLKVDVLEHINSDIRFSSETPSRATSSAFSTRTKTIREVSTLLAELSKKKR